MELAGIAQKDVYSFCSNFERRKNEQNMQYIITEANRLRN